jgi:biotin operon repressor
VQVPQPGSASISGAGAVTSCDAVRTFVERMSIAMYERGMPRMPARVLVVLLCSEGEAVTARQLTAALGVSPAAISSAVNHLMQVGMLVREPIPGSRQEHYRLPPGGVLGAIMQKSAAAPDLADIAEEGIEVLGGAGTPGGARLTEVSEFVRFMDAEMRGVWDRWKARQAAAEADA